MCTSKQALRFVKRALRDNGFRPQQEAVTNEGAKLSFSVHHKGMGKNVIGLIEVTLMGNGRVLVSHEKALVPVPRWPVADSSAFLTIDEATPKSIKKEAKKANRELTRRIRPFLKAVAQREALTRDLLGFERDVMLASLKKTKKAVGVKPTA